MVKEMLRCFKIIIIIIIATNIGVLLLLFKRTANVKRNPQGKRRLSLSIRALTNIRKINKFV